MRAVYRQTVAGIESEAGPIEPPIRSLYPRKEPRQYGLCIREADMRGMAEEQAVALLWRSFRIAEREEGVKISGPAIKWVKQDGERRLEAQGSEILD